METKDYNNGEITIVWEPGKCCHAGVCVKTLPQVYNPKEKPWIKIENATSEELKNQVAKCPSGALSIKQEANTIKIEREDDGKKGRFVIYENNVFAGEMTYTWAGDSKFIIDHTGVETAFEGKSFGKKLVMAAVDYAKENNLKIMPLCPFAAAIFNRNKDLQDLRF